MEGLLGFTGEALSLKKIGALAKETLVARRGEDGEGLATSRSYRKPMRYPSGDDQEASWSGVEAQVAALEGVVALQNIECLDRGRVGVDGNGSARRVGELE
jgi:hypothetical protein